MLKIQGLSLRNLSTGKNIKDTGNVFNESYADSGLINYIVPDLSELFACDRIN